MKYIRYWLLWLLRPFRRQPANITCVLSHRHGTQVLPGSEAFDKQWAELSAEQARDRARPPQGRIPGC